LGVANKIVARSGAWFKYGEAYLGQGKEKARTFLIENPEVAAQIKEQVLAAGGFGVTTSDEKETAEVEA
jgi:recombination protein RecA